MSETPESSSRSTLIPDHTDKPTTIDAQLELTDPNHQLYQSWPEIPGLIQMTLATFVPNHGWLVTKRSVIYGGRHGEPPMINDPEAALAGLTAELRLGLRAMKHRLDQT